VRKINTEGNNETLEGDHLAAGSFLEHQTPFALQEDHLHDAFGKNKLTYNSVCISKSRPIPDLMATLATTENKRVSQQLLVVHEELQEGAAKDSRADPSVFMESKEG